MRSERFSIGVCSEGTMCFAMPPRKSGVKYAGALRLLLG